MSLMFSTTFFSNYTYKTSMFETIQKLRQIVEVGERWKTPVWNIQEVNRLTENEFFNSVGCQCHISKMTDSPPDKDGVRLPTLRDTCVYKNYYMSPKL